VHLSLAPILKGQDVLTLEDRGGGRYGGLVQFVCSCQCVLFIL